MHKKLYIIQNLSRSFLQPIMSQRRRGFHKYRTIFVTVVLRLLFTKTVSILTASIYLVVNPNRAISTAPVRVTNLDFFFPLPFNSRNNTHENHNGLFLTAL